METMMDEFMRAAVDEAELLRSRGAQVQVLHDAECIVPMGRFIAARPRRWNEDIGE
jgi:creatinine deaminase